MFTCILCKQGFHDDNATEEHIFPESLGGTLTLREVCVRCNSHLGRTADGYLVDHPYMQWSRRRFKLAGKSGRIPNPLENGNVAGDPARRVRWKAEGGSTSIPSRSAVPTAAQSSP